MACCGSFQDRVDQQFTPNKVDKELQRYRRKGGGPTTRLLLDGLVKAGLTKGALLDVGAGVGALTFELLDRGIRRAVIVEASSRGRSADVELVHGDFLDVGEGVPAATVVTLDRVICCYPFYERLLTQALQHAQDGFAFSYPRDRWYVKAGVRLENAMRRRGSGFRAFVHPEARMRQMIEDRGFDLVSHGQTFMWSADVFIRRP